MMSDQKSYIVFGATGGIGSEVSRRLAAGGNCLCLAARGRDRLDLLAGDLGGARVAPVDATDLAAVDTVVKDCAGEFGRVDGIVNCVGSIILKAAHQTSEEEWRQTIAANLDSAFAVVRSGARAMRRDGGSIVLMSSAAARVGLPSHEAIAAAKAGVIGLARSAAASYAGKGVRVNVVAPGLVDTPLAAGITTNPLMLKASEAMHPLGRIGRPDEVAAAITWLLTEQSAWVTGEVIGVDGGLASVRTKTAG
jgi:NAD(P)-dependent dehydrogenase (short-subunit alcohol dehydrogenase family)